MAKQSQSQGKGKKTSIVIALLLLLAVVTIGYASLSATLNISGTSKIKDNTWEVEPDEDDPEVIVCATGEICTINPQTETPPRDPATLEPDDGVPTTENPNPNGAIVWMDGNTVYFKHLLVEPGDSFTFTTKFSNTGSIDAKVAGVNKTSLTTTQAKFLTYTVTYEDGTEVKAGDSLAAGADHVLRPQHGVPHASAIDSAARPAHAVDATAVDIGPAQP